MDAFAQGRPNNERTSMMPYADSKSTSFGFRNEANPGCESHLRHPYCDSRLATSDHESQSDSRSNNQSNTAGVVGDRDTLGRGEQMSVSRRTFPRVAPPHSLCFDHQQRIIKKIASQFSPRTWQSVAERGKVWLDGRFEAALMQRSSATRG